MNLKLCILLIVIIVIQKNAGMVSDTSKSSIDALLYTIESESTYPNPDAPYRIDSAGSQLITYSLDYVTQRWQNSSARSNASKLVTNSKKVMDEKWGTDLEMSGQMLYIQAELIRCAIDLIDEKIKLLH